jgi:hypothetical protein
VTKPSISRPTLHVMRGRSEIEGQSAARRSRH